MIRFVLIPTIQWDFNDTLSKIRRYSNSSDSTKEFFMNNSEEKFKRGDSINQMLWEK